MEEEMQYYAHIKSKRRKVDVICLHTKDGRIKPMRIRLIDEDGLPQIFDIKGYLDHSHHGARTIPDGMSVTNETLISENNLACITFIYCFS